MSILENKHTLKDIQAQLAAERKKGLDMATQGKATLEEMQAQSTAIDNLAIRAALIKQDIDQEENQGRDQLPQNQRPKTPGAFQSLGEFLSAVHLSDAPGGMRDGRLIRGDATGANEGVPSEGGYLVPPEYADGVIDLIETQSILFPQARRVQIESNRLVEIYLDEKSRKDGNSRHGGILAYWTGEAAQYQASKAAFQQRSTQLQKLTAYCPVTEELLQDAPAIESIVSQKAGQEFAFKMDDAIINGTGNGMPLGILAYHASNPEQNNAALISIAKETDQAAGTLHIQNILKMYNALIASNRGKSKWYINQDLELQLMQLLMPTGEIKSTGTSPVENIVGSFGAPIYTPPGAYGMEDARLLGRPVQVLEQCNEAGKKGDILLADMSQYLIVERSTGIEKRMSMHVRFDYDETVFKFTWRVGGRPDWMNPIEGYKGSTKRSPYVALGNR